MSIQKDDLLLFLSLLALMGLLGWHPHVERLTWSLEVLPLLIGLPLLGATYQRFRFCRLTYGMIWALGVLIIIGAYYGFSQVPGFSWLQQTFDLPRNDFDRLAHLMLGATAAVVVREMLLRLSWLGRGKWLFFLVACVGVTVGASYELFEWGVARTLGERADAFLGAQGDPWDSHWDMLLTATGAVLGQLLLSRKQDEQIDELDPTLLYRK